MLRIYNLPPLSLGARRGNSQGSALVAVGRDVATFYFRLVNVEENGQWIAEQRKGSSHILHNCPQQPGSVGNVGLKIICVG